MSEKPKRIQRKLTKGWKMPENTIYVGRPSKWGNWFYGPASIHSMNVQAYRALLTRDFKWFRSTGYFKLTAGVAFSWSLKTQADVDRLLAPLRGKDLACWCPLDQPCHADILLELANQ